VAAAGAARVMDAVATRAGLALAVAGAVAAHRMA
jgi:hypothetical protein